jgi:hypothetical protein
LDPASSIQKLVGLPHQGLAEFEAQNCGVKPVEPGFFIRSSGNQRVQKLTLTSTFIPVDVLLTAFIQNQLLFCCFHNGFSRLSKQLSYSFFIGLNDNLLSLILKIMKNYGTYSAP